MINVELPQLIKTLDKESHLALEQGAQLCVARGGTEVLCEDFILAALNNPQSFWNKACQQYQVSSERLIEALQHGRKSTVSESNHPVLSTALIEWLQESYLYSMLEMKLAEVLAANLLLTLLSHPNKYGHTPYYRELSVIPASSLKQQVEGLIDSVTQNEHTNHEHQSALEAYTTNYTQLAKEDKIDPVLCRDSEIRQMIDILARRRKNNPMIVGEAGVGKTALVEGLAIKIAHGEVPDLLQNVSLLSLDLGLLQAGASIKGEFERRLNLVITAVQESPSPIILFIDEAHTLIGAGGQAGSNDAANLLKPALARGELRTIGATTWSEYKKYIEKDPQKRFVQLPNRYFDPYNSNGFTGTKKWHKIQQQRQREVQVKLIVHAQIKRFLNNEMKEAAKRKPPLELYRDCEQRIGKLGDPVLLEQFHSAVLNPTVNRTLYAN